MYKRDWHTKQKSVSYHRGEREREGEQHTNTDIYVYIYIYKGFLPLKLIFILV